MPYQHCPTCRLTVSGQTVKDAGAPCPRCGEALASRPRRLFASTAPSGLDPEAVRLMLATRGGRFSRQRRPSPG